MNNKHILGLALLEKRENKEVHLYIKEITLGEVLKNYNERQQDTLTRLTEKIKKVSMLRKSR